MFDVYGEFNSCEEINMSAEGMFNEGDFDSIRAMAAENGIDGEVVSMYLEGETEKLCDVYEAAYGKIEVEEADLKPQEIMIDWIEYLKVETMGNEDLARKVRMKGKSLKGMIAEILKWSFENQHDIDREIREAAGVKARVTLGIPGMGRAKKTIREYYEG